MQKLIINVFKRYISLRYFFFKKKKKKKKKKSKIKYPNQIIILFIS